MGLKRRNKAIAEFNMSSLTDIIFLLLIFFMLTSSPDKSTPVEHVVTVMDIAMRLDINGILTPEQ